MIFTFTPLLNFLQNRAQRIYTVIYIFFPFAELIHVEPVDEIS